MSAGDSKARDAGVARVRRVSAGLTIGTLAATGISAVALQATLPDHNSKSGTTTPTDAAKKQPTYPKVRPVVVPRIREDAPQITTVQVQRRAPNASAPRPAAPAQAPQPAPAEQAPAATSSGS